MPQINIGSQSDTHYLGQLVYFADLWGGQLNSLNRWVRIRKSLNRQKTFYQ